MTAPVLSFATDVTTTPFAAKETRSPYRSAERACGVFPKCEPLETSHGAVFRNRFLEGRRQAQGMGRHRPGRAAEDDPLHAHLGGDPQILPGDGRNPPALFRRSLCAQDRLWRSDRAA